MTHNATRALALLITALIGIASPQSTQLLFTLERNKNSNKLYYEARITKDGSLDLQESIHIYWILWNKDSTGKTREELSLIEKNMVYGCKTHKNATRKCFSMSIVSYPDRTIQVSLQNGKPVAETVINGQASYLDKIYINYRETRMFPKVNYIELFGRSVKNGEPQYEKFKPT